MYKGTDRKGEDDILICRELEGDHCFEPWWSFPSLKELIMSRRYFFPEDPIWTQKTRVECQALPFNEVILANSLTSLTLHFLIRKMKTTTVHLNYFYSTSTKMVSKCQQHPSSTCSCEMSSSISCQKVKLICAPLWVRVGLVATSPREYSRYAYN